LELLTPFKFSIIYIYRWGEAAPKATRAIRARTIVLAHIGQKKSMATMSVRATYGLDAETAGLIRRLAATWEVSQAEVIRRSVRMSAASQRPADPSAAEVLAHYRAHPAPLGSCIFQSQRRGN